MASTTDASAPVTQWLAQVRQGDSASLDTVYAALYQELKTAAHAQLRRRHRSFDTTALVHEAYLKMAGGAVLAAQDRQHMIALSVRAMRHVLVDEARARHADKRGGGEMVNALEVDIAATDDSALDVLLLEKLLEELRAIDERMTQIVELRYFGGYGFEEIADILQISDRSVRRDWRKARAYLVARA